MKSRTLLVLAAAALLSTSVLAQSKKATRPTIEGVWRVVETTGGPNAIKNTSPQPALYLFSRTYYSWVGVYGPKPRPDLPDDLTKASAAEMIAAVSGLGYMLNMGGELRRPEVVVVGMILIAVVNALLDRVVFGSLERRFIARWKR